MVSVNIDTIDELLPEIESCIKQADFIALDTEFSGLNIGSGSRESRFDQAHHRYSRFRQNVREASLLQFGLACFTRLPKAVPDHGDNLDQQRTYKVTCFNIVLAPADTGLKDFRTKNFVSEWSAMRFLKNHGFDLNEVIERGVPNLSIAELEHLAVKLRRGICALKDAEFSSEALRMAETDAQSVESIIDSANGSFEPQQLRGLRSPPIALHCVLREMFPRIWTTPLSWNSMQFQFVNANQRAAFENNDRSVEEWFLKQSSLGGKIFAQIIQEKKILVGFQLLQDLMFLVDTFYGPIPEDYADFKAIIREVFPNLYDGKVITQAVSRMENINGFGHFDAPSLEELFSTMKSAKTTGVFQYGPKFEQDDRHDHYDTENKAHEAAYDAYMAGVVFLNTIFVLNASKVAEIRNRTLQAAARTLPASGRQREATLHTLPPLLLLRTEMDFAALDEYRGLLYLHIAADKTMNVFGEDEQAVRSKAWVRLVSGNEMVPVCKSQVLAVFLQACVYEHHIVSQEEIIIACPSQERATKVAEYANNFLGVKASVFDSCTMRKLDEHRVIKSKRSYSKMIFWASLCVLVGVGFRKLSGRIW
ncbi:poly(A)-specific ribonuclease PNLDC1-like [Paramacrobiotus metropolitanus]|uniref:poly(A)-specific ribonuclease PNLDC1-like n=1 Tax=Paramacrobiotus metropolitanus TaxID=2943436 RepID=UPI002445C5A7|nr:poly(A)-specific ribonuclease PNLDC1-like [Paramacrobiotus metropolitanus]